MDLNFSNVTLELTSQKANQKLLKKMKDFKNSVTTDMNIKVKEKTFHVMIHLVMKNQPTVHQLRQKVKENGEEKQKNNQNQKNFHQNQTTPTFQTKKKEVQKFQTIAAVTPLQLEQLQKRKLKKIQTCLVLEKHGFQKMTLKRKLKKNLKEKKKKEEKNQKNNLISKLLPRRNMKRKVILKRTRKVILTKKKKKKRNPIINLQLLNQKKLRNQQIQMLLMF
jgi:hypothetical protein